MDLWDVQQEALKDLPGVKLHILENADYLTFAAVIGLWRESQAFRTLFTKVLAKLPYSAFRWETPPVARDSVGRIFECVVLDSRELLRAPEPDVFTTEFAGRQAPDVIGFPNLGGDAFMVVPCPGEPASAYAHLAAFVREAPVEQRDRLWQTVGEAMQERLGEAPIWLNTAGAGVAWLHVRLDSRPKYYRHVPYRSAPGSRSFDATDARRA